MPNTTSLPAPVMPAHMELAKPDFHSLENVELTMALEGQDIMATGFEASVRRASDQIGAEFLFNIPAPASLPFQRAALVNLPSGEHELVLVTLSADGTRMEVQIENAETAHLFRLGEAWLAVVSQFQSLS